MQRITRDHLCSEMSPHNAPVAHVAPGDEVVVETHDAYRGSLTADTSGPAAEASYGPLPITGPIYVDGVMPGDILRVDIQHISIMDHAVMRLRPSTGALRRWVTAAEARILPIRDGAVVLREGVSLPVRPMIGMIGIAPRRRAIQNMEPGEHGGNLDCKEIVAGVSLYLPVFVPGALLSLGDLHAVMGDGEVAICGAEIAGEVTIRCALVHSSLPTPCVESSDSLFFLGSARSLDKCERVVLEKAMRFLTQNLRLDAMDAARVMSLAGDLQVCQVVDPLKTMRFALPTPLLRSLGMGDRAAG